MTSRGRPRWQISLQRFPTPVVAVLGIAITVTVILLLEAMDAPYGAYVFSVVIVLVLVGAIAVGSVAIRRAEDLAVQQRAHPDVPAGDDVWLRGVEACVWRWPPPPVGDADPQSLTEVASDDATVSRSGAVPATYVQRDVDEQGSERLRRHGIVLLVGAPLSGVTRTAYHLAQVEHSISPRALLAPIAPFGLQRALEEFDLLSRLAPPQRIVLWLDEVERFAGGGLTVQMLRLCKQHWPGLRIIATISSTAYPSWVEDEKEVANAFREPVIVQRLLAPRERTRAEEIYPGEDFSEGVAAPFTVIGSLLKRMYGGDHACPFERDGADCSLARGFLDIVMAWTATGTPRPLPLTMAPQLVQRWLGFRQTPSSDHVDRVLSWASTPTAEGRSLLTVEPASTVSPARIRIHPGLAEVLKADTSIEEQIWKAALHEAVDAHDSEAVGELGYHAHVRDEDAQASDAWVKITSVREPGARWLEKADSFSAGSHRPGRRIPPLMRLLELNEADKGPDGYEVARVLAKLGRVHYQIGEAGQAIEFYQRALRIFEAAPERYGLDEPHVLGGMGDAWLHLGDINRALDLHRRSLAIFEQKCTTDDHHVAHSLVDLSHALLESGEPLEALSLVERALVIRQREYGPDHPEVADTLDNLGQIWLELGELTKAAEVTERALTMVESEYGQDHEQVGVTLNNLGTIYLELNRPREAQRLLERALRIRRRNYGRNHSNVAVVWVNLAHAHRQAGNAAKALDLYQQALTILEADLGPDHPTVANVLDSIGVSWRIAGQPTKASEYHRRALMINERKYGPNHVRAADSVENLGKALANAGDVEDARELLQRAVRIRQERLGPSHRSTLSTLANLRIVAPDVVVLNNSEVIDVSDGAVGGHTTGPLDLPK